MKEHYAVNSGFTFCIVLSVAITGQTNKSGISGTVTDSKGSVILGATVTVTNVGTNQTKTLTTSDEGNFSVNSLEPVIYTVKVESPSFKETTVQNVKVDTASTATVNVMLEAGGIGESVTIEADAPLINTENGTTGQTITERQLRELPLSNRSVLDLASTVPNVSGDAGSEDAEVTSGQPVPGFNLNVNGGRSGGTNLLADGVNNTGVGIARAVVSFTPETVQEFTVQTSAFSAEFGSTGGGVINITTKSGTNRFNGTALVYHRNPATNAQPYRIGTMPRTPKICVIRKVRCQSAVRYSYRHLMKADRKFTTGATKHFSFSPMNRAGDRILSPPRLYCRPLPNAPATSEG